MEKKVLGRPTNDKLILSKEDIVKKALEILGEQGESGLSYRKLAKEFGVTAMALKHHVGSRKNLLESMVELVYRDVNAVSVSNNSKEIIKELLGNYCNCVFKHPNVSKMVLADHSLLNHELLELTNIIRKHATSLVKGKEEGILFADVIIDYTHGFALAATTQNEKTNLGTLTIDDFFKGLDWLLARV